MYTSELIKLLYRELDSTYRVMGARDIPDGYCSHAEPIQEEI